MTYFRSHKPQITKSLYEIRLGQTQSYVKSSILGKVYVQVYINPRLNNVASKRIPKSKYNYSQNVVQYLRRFSCIVGISYLRLYSLDILCVVKIPGRRCIVKGGINVSKYYQVCHKFVVCLYVIPYFVNSGNRLLIVVH